jgi:anti-sigma factor RsiW
MTLDDFERLAGTWGGDVARWPEHLRAEAAAMARAPEAAAVLAEARELDQLLNDAAPEIADARIDRAIRRVTVRLAQDTVQPSRAPRGWLGTLAENWFAPAAGFACAALIGMLLGVADPLGTEQGEDDVHTMISMILDVDTTGQGITR